MKRAAVILTSNELNPFYSIVTFNDDGKKWFLANEDVETLTVRAMEDQLDEAVRAHFRENWEAPEGDSPDDWFEDILGDYTYFYIGTDIASKLVKVTIPTPDVEHLNNSDDAARELLEQLMISVCEQFAYTSRFSRQE